MSEYPNAEELAKSILAESDHSSPPSNLDAICNLWSSLSVVEGDFEKEGYLIPLGVHGAEILVRKKDPLPRKRFTIAHEIGHWVLANLNGGSISFDKPKSPIISISSHRSRNTPEETWCNKFAAALLIPTVDLIEYIGSTKDQNLLERIVRGPSIFCVSYEAFMNRISEVTCVSLFEMVKVDEKFTIRRRFISQMESQNQTEVDQVIEDLLKSSKDKKYPPQGSVWKNKYNTRTNLTRSSKYSKSWLVSIYPAR